MTEEVVGAMDTAHCQPTANYIAHWKSARELLFQKIQP